MAERPKTTERRDAHAADNGADAEPTTGVYPATRDFVREVNRSGLWKVAVGVGSFALACFVTGVTVTKAMAQQAKDAGVEAAAAVQRQATDTDARLNRMSSEFTEHVQTEAERSARMEKKINAILDRLDVKDPAPTPPAPKDGGR
jgi:hypothetical protein